jgi:hypothetical protein
MRGKFEDQLSLDLPQMCRAMAVTTLGHQQSLGLHVIPQHEFLRVRMEVYLLVYPVRNRMPVQMMLEPVRSYVSGTTSGTIPCR